MPWLVVFEWVCLCSVLQKFYDAIDVIGSLEAIDDDMLGSGDRLDKSHRSHRAPVLVCCSSCHSSDR